MVLREIQVWVLEMELMKVPRDKVDAVDERQEFVDDDVADVVDSKLVDVDDAALVVTQEEKGEGLLS